MYRSKQVLTNREAKIIAGNYLCFPGSWKADVIRSVFIGRAKVTCKIKCENVGWQ